MCKFRIIEWIDFEDDGAKDGKGSYWLWLLQLKMVSREKDWQTPKEKRDRWTAIKVLWHLHGEEKSDRMSGWWRTGPARGYREWRKDDNGLTAAWDGRGLGRRRGRCWGKKAKKARELRRGRRVEEEEEHREERKVYSLGQAVKTGAECITLMPWTGVNLSREDAVGWKKRGEQRWR